MRRIIVGEEGTGTEGPVGEYLTALGGKSASKAQAHASCSLQPPRWVGFVFDYNAFDQASIRFRLGSLTPSLDAGRGRISHSCGALLVSRTQQVIEK
jgi:hypothetical protein